MYVNNSVAPIASIKCLRYKWVTSSSSRYTWSCFHFHCHIQSKHWFIFCLSHTHHSSWFLKLWHNTIIISMIYLKTDLASHKTTPLWSSLLWSPQRSFKCSGKRVPFISSPRQTGRLERQVQRGNAWCWNYSLKVMKHWGGGGGGGGKEKKLKILLILITCITINLEHPSHKKYAKKATTTFFSSFHAWCHHL